MKRHLRVALLLQVCDDRLANQLGVTHHVQHFIILAMDEGELELELGWVDVQHARTTLTVEAVNILTFDPGDVDGYIESSDDAMVPVNR